MSSEIAAQGTFWERAARSAWGTYISEIEKEAVLRAHDIAGKPARALEIGCEGGRWSKLFSDLNWKMTCTDIDPRVLKICQLRLPTASCVAVEPGSREIPCETNSIGLLLCVEVPPVIKSRWFLDESRRVLTEGGLIVGVFFNLVRAGVCWLTSRPRCAEVMTTLVSPIQLGERRFAVMASTLFMRGGFAGSRLGGQATQVLFSLCWD